MNNRMITVLTSLLLFCTLLIPAGVFGENEAGRVLAIKKKVFRIRDNVAENARPQMPLLKRDAVATDRKSRTKLFFTDDSILNLGELSKVEVEEYLYSSEKNRSKSIYKLMDGYMKVIVGRSDLEIHTPTAVASARGTKFIVSIEGMDQKFTRIIVLEGKVETWNIAPGVQGAVIVNQGQMNKVPAQKPPEPVKPIDMDVMKQFVDNTIVISDAAVVKEILPTMLVEETKPVMTGTGTGTGESEVFTPLTIPTEPPIPDYQPPEALSTPVKINVNFP